MQLSDFDYELPESLIAANPLAERSASRLLVPQSSNPHRHFADILAEFVAGDVLVINDTRVMKARLYGQKITGGKVELLLEQIIDSTHALAHVKANKSLKPGTLFNINDAVLEVTGRKDSLFELELKSGDFYQLMEQQGELPLPHYMNRAADESDTERYQTVYANKLGAVAAPTAGLHFTPDLLEQLERRGVLIQRITLHVGAGTFQPVRVDNIKEHKMHAEWIDVPQSVVDVIVQAKAQGGRVFAVGTTSLRSLETAAQHGQLEAFKGETDIFIYPGFKFNVVDKLITNFHLPQSTLLMLVSAFAGFDLIKTSYAIAIKEQYRFFSYGDAMLLTREDHEV